MNPTIRAARVTTAAASGGCDLIPVAEIERLLEIGHLTSSTDVAGAIRLARAALPRLAVAR